MTDLLAHLALGTTTLLAWLGLGSVVLARGPRVGDAILDLLNRVGVGALSFALLTFGAGWAGLLYRAAYLPVFVVATLAGFAAALKAAGSVSRIQPAGWAWWELALAGLLVVYVAIDLVAVCAPPSSPDALLYHLANPALFEKAHHVVEIPWNSSSYEPFSVEMLMLDGMLLWDPVQGAFAPFLLSLVALACVTGFTYRFGGRPLALLAGVIFFAQPFMVWEATSSFVESGIAMAVALAAWNIVQFAGRADGRALVLAGVFAGGAAGMKYVGLIAGVVAGVAAGLAVSQRLNVRVALVFALPAVAVALPWYVKNAVLTGNPVYPHLFGGLNAAAAGELSYTMQQFGYGRSPTDFLLLPSRLLSAAKPFDGGEYLSPLFVIFTPVALLLRPPSRAVLIAAGAVLVYVVVWFLTSQQARFLVPAMPVAAVLAAVGVVALARRGRAGRLLAVSVTAAALAVGLAASTVYAAQFVPVVLGTQPKTQFLREKVSDFDGVEWLNENLGDRDKVATDIWALFYLRRPYVTFGTMGDLLPPNAGPTATRAFIAKYGITHVAILDNDVPRRRQVESLHPRLIERVPVRSVQSRTLGHFGPPHEMLVYDVSDS